jgi:hypothetical protein
MFQILPGFEVVKLNPGSLYVAELTLTPKSASDFLADGFTQENWGVIGRSPLMSYHGTNADILKVLNLTAPNSFSQIKQRQKAFEDYAFALSIDDYQRMASSFPSLQKA